MTYSETVAKPARNYSIYACPCRAKSRLRQLGDRLCCTNKGCLHNKKKSGFHIIDDVPVIISQDLCDTVCDPEMVESYVERSSQKLSTLGKILSGTSPVTKSNANYFGRLITRESVPAKVLVIGAGERGSGTEALWNDPQIEIEGVDIYIAETVDVVCDAHYLPYPDEAFDGVWIQAVLEHVVEPQVVVAEIHRVLKPSGIVYAETPFMQQVHEGAYDFTRFTVLGHRYLFRDFALIRLGGNKGAEQALSWSLRYFVWALTRSRFLARVVGFGAQMALRPLAKLLSKQALFDSSSGVFFLGKKSTKRIRHRDVIGLYKGLG